MADFKLPADSAKLQSAIKDVKSKGKEKILSEEFKYEAVQDNKELEGREKAVKDAVQNMNMPGAEAKTSMFNAIEKEFGFDNFFTILDTNADEKLDKDEIAQLAALNEWGGTDKVTNLDINALKDEILDDSTVTADTPKMTQGSQGYHEAKNAEHEVVKGDNLYKIMSAEYGDNLSSTDRTAILSAIMDANPEIYGDDSKRGLSGGTGRESKLIYPGDKLILPPSVGTKPVDQAAPVASTDPVVTAADTSKPVATGYYEAKSTEHEVAKGEHLYKIISAEFGGNIPAGDIKVALSAIMDANPAIYGDDSKRGFSGDSTERQSRILMPGDKLVIPASIGTKPTDPPSPAP